MKKILLSLSCAVALALASCGGDTSIAGTFNGFTKKIEKARTPEQVIKIANELDAKYEKLEEEYNYDIPMTEADEVAFEKMMEAMQDACERTGLNIHDVL